ncbi:hypothetical protein [Hymenobacter wooponensis]|uniref:STAS/SEC14 domain-containing protein n=1 Tax=Hymenobacter wooponensis TaxID=1525360 RepID=A0A4Z0MPZ6_9BACT|nr:hypothetical protein [Hymenobacter wooponensis]TGD81317.1 hypothetical protein EU557_07050 [Hymenobacter wooponensis]
MKISKHTDLRDGSSCELEFDEGEGWLRAIWLGYVDPMEAYNGAENFLKAMQDLHCPYLLNDNSKLSGPWFDSVEWLRSVWVPRAVHLGLRYIAHVVQPHDLLDEAANTDAYAFDDQLRLQLFDDVPSAEEWLREMRVKQQV